MTIDRAACPEHRRRNEFGQPQSTNLGKFGYTGQAWLPEIGAWYYKARVQEPELGRFLQPDPIGYEGGMNLYAYVGNDPVNIIDPLGLCGRPGEEACSDTVVGQYRDPWWMRYLMQLRSSDGTSGAGGGRGGGGGGRGGFHPGMPKPAEKLRTCEVRWLTNILAPLGVPTASLSNISFNYGLNNIFEMLNPVTLIGYGRATTGAITSGTSVFVKPSRWAEFTTLGSASKYEEVFHALQFEAAGHLGLYARYAASAARAWATGGDAYWDNSVEEMAQDSADILTEMYDRDKPCG